MIFTWSFLFFTSVDGFPGLATPTAAVCVLVATLVFWAMSRGRNIVRDLARLVTAEDQGPIVHTAIHRAPMVPVAPLCMIKVENENDDYQSGVRLAIQCTEDMRTYVLWGADWKAMTQFIAATSSDECVAVLERGDEVLFSKLGSVMKFSKTTGDEIHHSLMKPPPPGCMEPGVPRKRCPFLLVSFADASENRSPNDCVVCIHAFHVYEPTFCAMKTRILGHYLKLASGRFISLQEFFNSAITDDETNPTCRTCVVCMSAPADHVLLPCKHQSTCAGCLGGLDGKCPICRARIVSFFACR